MAAKQPNSDRSGRAQRRRQERAEAKDTGQPAQPAAGGIPVNVRDLMAKIGQLTVERDYWNEQFFTLREEITKLKATLAPAEALEKKPAD